MHGGAPGSGAPPGNKNAFKTGRYTRQAKAERKTERKKIVEILRHARDLIEKVKRAATASS